MTNVIYGSAGLPDAVCPSVLTGLLGAAGPGAPGREYKVLRSHSYERLVGPKGLEPGRGLPLFSRGTGECRVRPAMGMSPSGYDKPFLAAALRTHG